MPRDLGQTNPVGFNIFDYNQVVGFFMNAHFKNKHVALIRWEEVPAHDGEKNWVWHLFWDHANKSQEQYREWVSTGGHGLVPFEMWFHPDMTQIVEFATEDEAVDVGNNFPESPEQDPNGAYGHAETWINGKIVTENT